MSPSLFEGVDMKVLLNLLLVCFGVWDFICLPFAAYDFITYPALQVGPDFITYPFDLGKFMTCWVGMAVVSWYIPAFLSLIIFCVDSAIRRVFSGR